LTLLEKKQNWLHTETFMSFKCPELLTPSILAFMFTESRQEEVWSDCVCYARYAERLYLEGMYTRTSGEQYKGALRHPELQMLCCLQNEAQ
jgi:hypothetical protein